MMGFLLHEWQLCWKVWQLTGVKFTVIAVTYWLGVVRFVALCLPSARPPTSMVSFDRGVELTHLVGSGSTLRGCRAIDRPGGGVAYHRGDRMPNMRRGIHWSGWVLCNTPWLLSDSDTALFSIRCSIFCVEHCLTQQYTHKTTSPYLPDILTDFVPVRTLRSSNTIRSLHSKTDRTCHFSLAHKN